MHCKTLGGSNVRQAVRFDEPFIQFEDRDGLMLTLNVPAATDNRPYWTTRDVSTAAAIKGFHSVTLTLRDREPTAEVLSGILGYRLQAREGNRYRFTTIRSEEHTSELQSLMRISYAVF